MALLLTACASPRGGWNSSDLEADHPAVSQIKRQRLSDTPPYFMPDGDGLILFLCRWSGADAIPVVLPSDADDSELAGLRLALDSWQEAGLGVRFREVSALQGQRGIEIRLFAAADETFPLVRTGDTIADCRLPAEPPADAAAQAINASIEWSSIFLRRANIDSLGRSVPLSEAQLAGQALHELGHALGFSGHVMALRSIMTRTHEVAKHWGEGVAAGKTFRDPHLSALYTVPSGTIVGRIDPSPERLASLRRFMASVRDDATWLGPYARVGDKDARIFWKRAEGSSSIFEIGDWVEVVRGKVPPALRINAAARGVIEQEH